MEEPCIFYSEAQDVFLIFFVDDIIIAYHKNNEEAANRVINSLKEAYDLEDKGEARFFLGIQIIRDRKNQKIYLSHKAYIDKISEKFGQAQKGTFPAIPIPATKLVMRIREATKLEIKVYQEKVGSVLYTAIMIRPDVAFAASKLLQFLTNPGPKHQKAVDQAIRYLATTSQVALCYGGTGDIRALEIASDASYADDPVTRRSSQGYIVMLFGGPIMWKATRQLTVTTSTTEAELLALQQTAKETMVLKRLFRDIKFNPQQDYEIKYDNQQTIRLVLNTSERINTRLRHVDINSMWLKQEYGKGSFGVAYLPTADMPADRFTKALSRQRFEHFKSLLNLVDLRTQPNIHELHAQEDHQRGA
ncbi:reverse transcriptase family protein, partial [Metarhizium majus ARSEF 297]